MPLLYLAQRPPIRFETTSSDTARHHVKWQLVENFVNNIFSPPAEVVQYIPTFAASPIIVQAYGNLHIKIEPNEPHDIRLS